MLIGGCAGGKNRRPVVAVRGEVFVKSRGKSAPPKGARVLFHIQNDDGEPLPLIPGGTVQEDGSFRVSTYEANDGLPVGDYKVTITWHKTQVLMGEEKPEGPDLLRGKYADPKKTRLVARVTSNGLEQSRFVLELP
jgi:hypothetical protein